MKIENIKGSKDAAAPIKTVIYNQDNETIKIIVDTVSGNNGISSTSLHKIAEWYLLYTTKFLELDKESQNMKTFDSTLGITYGGSHTYIYGFIKLFHDKYGKELQVPSYFTVDKDDKTPFVFIIDEINRGDINKILGELFYAIDTGYRGEKGIVDTQYQNLVESGDIFAKGFYNGTRQFPTAVGFGNVQFAEVKDVAARLNGAVTDFFFIFRKDEKITVMFAGNGVGNCLCRLEPVKHIIDLCFS